MEIDERQFLGSRTDDVIQAQAAALSSCIEEPTLEL
jgi:hypothetical protein